MPAKPNCLRGSSSVFFLRVYSQNLSRKRLFRKAVDVWYQGCPPLERVTYACLTKSFYPAFNDFSLNSSYFILQKLLNRTFLWHRCRHHICEVILCYIYDSLEIEPSKTPTINIFKKSKTSSINMSSL